MGGGTRGGKKIVEEGSSCKVNVERKEKKELPSHTSSKKKKKHQNTTFNHGGLRFWVKREETERKAK